MNAQQLKAKLAQHCGSEGTYRHPLNAMFTYTEAMKAMFDHAGSGAQWLGDILATESVIAESVKQHGCGAGVLSVSSAGTAELTFKVDPDSEECKSPSKIVFSKSITTDFPEGEWGFHIVSIMLGDRNVVVAMLSDEY